MKQQVKIRRTEQEIIDIERYLETEIVGPIEILVNENATLQYNRKTDLFEIVNSKGDIMRSVDGLREAVNQYENALIVIALTE